MHFIKAHPRTAPAICTLFCVIALLMLTGCGGPEATEEVAQDTKPTVTAMEIRPGLRRSFSTTGEVTANKTATLTAEFLLDVVTIHVQPGDTVQEGQLLLSLSSDSVRERYGSANVTYSTAVSGLQQSKITGETSVQAAEEALKSAESTLQKVLAQSAEERRQAEETRKAALLNQGLSEANSTTGLTSALRSVPVTVNSALTFADSRLEFSPEQKDLDYKYEIHIGSKDPIFRQQTKETLGETYKVLKAYVQDYEYAATLLDQTEVALEMMDKVFRTSVTSPDYSQNDLNDDIATLQTHLSAMRSLKSQLVSAKTSLDLTMQQNGSVSQTIVNAEAAYSATIARIDANEEQARRSVTERTIALQQARANATASEIQAKSTVDNAAANLRDASVSQDKLAIKAPFGGYVADIPVRNGDEVQPGTPLAIVENADTLKVVTYLSGDDIAQVRAGDIAVIDGVGEVAVTAVSPSADPVSKKYKVEILLSNADLSPGTFVTVTFAGNSDEGDTRIFVPVTAVHISAAEVFVWSIAQEGGATVVRKKPVTTGKVQGRYVEVTSGLRSSDIIVSEGGRSIEEDGTAVQLPSL